MEAYTNPCSLRDFKEIGEIEKLFFWGKTLFFSRYRNLCLFSSHFRFPVIELTTGKKLFAFPFCFSRQQVVCFKNNPKKNQASQGEFFFIKIHLKKQIDSSHFSFLVRCRFWTMYENPDKKFYRKSDKMKRELERSEGERVWGKGRVRRLGLSETKVSLIFIIFRSSKNIGKLLLRKR